MKFFVFSLFCLLVALTACEIQDKTVTPSPLPTSRRVTTQTPVAISVLKSPRGHIFGTVFCYQGYMQWDCVAELPSGNSFLGTLNNNSWSLDNRYAVVCIGVTHDSSCTGYQVWDMPNGKMVHSFYQHHTWKWSPVGQHQLVYLVESPYIEMLDKLIQFDPEFQSQQYLDECPNWLYQSFQQACTNFPGVFIGGQLDGLAPNAPLELEIFSHKNNWVWGSGIRQGDNSWIQRLRKAIGLTYDVIPKVEGYTSIPLSYTIQISGTQAFVVKDGRITTLDAKHLDFNFVKSSPPNPPIRVPYPRP